MNFLGGILADLRERRLLPVAIALTVALIAVPLLLLKSADAGTGATPVATTAGASATTAPRPPLVALAALRTSSSLDTFASKNPFASPDPVPELTSTDLLDTTPSSGGSSSSSSSSSGDGGGFSSSFGGSSSSSSTGGSSGGSSSPAPTISPVSPISRPTDPATPPSGGGDPDGDGKTTVTKALFTHEIDIAYGTRGKVRTIRDIRRLAMLPSAKQPQLVFLGVDPSATNAMFLVDGDFSQSGEGTCRPTPENCRFLSLKVADDEDEHLLLDEAQNEFYIRLRNIDRVMIDPDPTAGASSLSGLPPLLDVAEITRVK